MIKVIEANTQKQWSHAFKIRTLVFIEEQQVPAIEEIDEYDEHSPIFVAYDGDLAVATARLIFVNETETKIGRVAVLKEYREKGVGKELLRQLMRYTKTNTKTKTIKLGAQCSVIPFYEKLGFEAYGPIYLDAGIKHQDMQYTYEKEALE